MELGYNWISASSPLSFLHQFSTLFLSLFFFSFSGVQGGGNGRARYLGTSHLECRLHRLQESIFFFLAMRVSNYLTGIELRTFLLLFKLFKPTQSISKFNISILHIYSVREVKDSTRAVKMGLAREASPTQPATWVGLG